MFRAVIIEDEVPAIVTLKSFLKRYFEGEIVVGKEIDNITEAVDYLSSTNDIHIIFLDVHLTDGSGLDILNQINTSEYKIIFTTAFNDYTLDAFKNKAFGYLLKPIDPIDFKTIVNRALKDLSIPEDFFPKEKVKVSHGTGYTWIDQKEIIRLESDSNYTKLIVKNSSNIFTISKTLKHVQNEIINNSRFFRCHQSHLINTDHFDRNQIIDGYVIMNNSDKIPISRSHQKEFSELMRNRL